MTCKKRDFILVLALCPQRVKAVTDPWEMGYRQTRLEITWGSMEHN